MLYTDKVKDLWALMEWPDLHWVRKAFVLLDEVEFKFTPPKLEELLQEKWSGMKQTLANELVNGRMKRRHLYHPDHAMTATEVWHTQITSSVLEEFGRKGPVITTASRNAVSRNFQRIYLIRKSGRTLLANSMTNLAPSARG